MILALALAAASLFSDLHWRDIGPYRGGRTKAASGVPQRPGTFYVGAVNGGVFRTDDYGRTWTPIFDDQPTGSIGAHRRRALESRTSSTSAAARASSGPTSPSATASTSRPTRGKTWTHLGLRDGAADPARSRSTPATRTGSSWRCSDIPTGPNPERGIFRSTDGGKTLREGALQGREHRRAPTCSSIPPTRASSMRRCGRRGRRPWENGDFARPGQRALQVDRRRHHLEAAHAGPADRRARRARPHRHRGRAARPDAPLRHRRRRRRTAASTARTTRGETLERGQRRPRVCGRRGGDFAEVKVDPKNPDVVYVANIVDLEVDRRRQDLHRVPRRAGRRRLPPHLDQSRRPDIILIAADQGAIVTRQRRRRRWSSLVQPADRADSTTSPPTTRSPTGCAAASRRAARPACSSRGDDGQITFRDWHPVGVEEYGYVAPDPLDPDLVYGGKISRYDRRTGQVQDITPEPLRAPELPRRPHAAGRSSRPPTRTRSSSPPTRCGRRATAARAGQQISPDLTRETWEVPAERRHLPRLDRGEAAAARRDLRARARRRSTRTSSGPAPTTA